MRKILLAAFNLLLVAAVHAKTVTYTPDNTSVFLNPERGFITEFDHVVTKKKPHCVKGKEQDLKDNYINKDQISLLLVLYYLDNFKNTATLPAEVLNGFDEDMQVLRNLGMKAILRFAYTEDFSDEIGHDAPLSVVQSHVAQYKSHWEANADVIFVFQAGFVGTWGEWYYTDHFGNKDNVTNESRRAVVDTLLAAVPAGRCIQMRTPLFKTSYIGSTAPLTAEEAYQNTPKARLAHHNDAFLENDNNLGTYVDTTTEKPYIAQETLYVPIGGESCILEPEVAAVNASHDATVAEMSRLHWTFIQNSYSKEVTDPWRENGTFDELNRNLGYRFQLVSGTYSDEVEHGNPLSVQLQIRNAGYAPLYNERPAYIVLKDINNPSSLVSLRLVSDPRRWLPNGAVTTIDEQLEVPVSVMDGTYELYLYLPDLSDKLSADPRYAVRFANMDVWDAETGMNRLNATVTISSPTTGMAQAQTFSCSDKAYDVLGRPVGDRHTEVVIQNGQKELSIK